MTEKSTAQILRDALALLDGGKAWTKGTYGRDANGAPVFSERSPDAVSFCMVGALCRAADAWDGSEEVLPAKGLLADCVPRRLIARFNDADCTAFPDVQRVFECAIAKAEKAESPDA